MKVLKTIIIVLVTLVALFFIVSLFLPGEYRVERTVTINANIVTVYEQVVNLDKWDKWSPWKMMDAGADYKFEGTMGKAGSAMIWKGAKIGEGSLTIEAVDSNKSINTKLSFLKPFESHSNGEWMFEDNGGKTVVTWANLGKLNGPVEKYFGLGMDGMIGPDFEKGLNRLKMVSEKIKVEKPVEAME